MTAEEKNITREVISRLYRLKNTCFKFPNPYYMKGEFPTEYQDIKAKIIQLEKLIK